MGLLAVAPAVMFVPTAGLTTIFSTMFTGFKKVKSKSSNTVHLSSNGWSTICGVSINNEWNEQGEISDDESICKNCRYSIIKKGKGDEVKQ